MLQCINTLYSILGKKFSWLYSKSWNNYISIPTWLLTMQGLPISPVTYSRNPIRPRGPLGAGIPSHTHQPDWIDQCDGDGHHHHHFVPVKLLIMRSVEEISSALWESWCPLATWRCWCNPSPNLRITFTKSIDNYNLHEQHFIPSPNFKFGLGMIISGISISGKYDCHENF